MLKQKIFSKTVSKMTIKVYILLSRYCFKTYKILHLIVLNLVIKSYPKDNLFSLLIMLQEEKLVPSLKRRFYLFTEWDKIWIVTFVEDF